MLLDMGSYIIIIEIDEGAHINYDCSCENKRTMELSQDLGHRPIVFIRFNPDSYIDKDSNKVSSCWRLNKQGILTIPKTRLVEWDNRIEALESQIKYWIDNPSSKTIEVIELFY